MKSALLLSVCLFACTTEENLGDTVTSTARWGLALGERGYERAMAVAIDSHGDVIVGGDGSLGSADLGNGTIGNDNYWAYLTKRAGIDGGPIWTVPLIGADAASSAFVANIAVDADDAFVVTGSFEGTVSFGVGAPPVTSSSDLFVAKYASDGTLQWVRTFGPNSQACGNAIGVDGAGNIFVGGYYYNGSFDFLGVHHAEPDGNGASFVVSYAPDGTPRWGNVFDPPARTTVSGLAMSATGDVVITGSFSTTVSLGGGIMNPNAMIRGFVARYHGDGSFMWSGAVGPTSSDSSRTDLGGVTIDAHDRIIFQADESAVYAVSNESPTINVLDPSGASEWSYTGHNNESIPPGGVVARADGTVVSSAWIDNNDANDTGSLQLQLFDTAGNLTTSSLGQRLIAGGRLTCIFDSAVGPSGEIAVVGELGGEVLIGQGAIESHGTNDTDGLVILIDP